MKTREKSEAVQAAENLLRELENHRDSLRILMNRMDMEKIPVEQSFMLLTHIVLFLNGTESQMKMIQSVISAIEKLESEDK